MPQRWSVDLRGGLVSSALCWHAPAVDLLGDEVVVVVVVAPAAAVAVAAADAASSASCS